MIDGFNNLAAGMFIGWTVLFAVSAALMIASAIVVRKVPEPKGHATSENPVTAEG